MMKMLSASALVVLLASPAAAQNPSTTPTPATAVKATPQNAAAFAGDWDLSGEGSNGPASFTLSLKPQGETLTAVLANADGVAQTVHDISMLGADLSLSVSFNSASGEYPAAVTLTPSGDKILLHIEVAGGLAQLDGTAKQKIQK